MGSAHPTGTVADAQLQQDIKPALRTNETSAQAQTRVTKARAELEYRRIEATYTALGDKPPVIDIKANDARYPDAHTLERHGPNVPLRRIDAPARDRTIEGRCYGDYPWNPKPEKNSSRWLNEIDMNRSINAYIKAKWNTIREDLAANTEGHEGMYDAGRVIGEGYANVGTKTVPNIKYIRTSLYMVRIKLHPGNPPTIEVRTAFPNARGY